MSITLSAETNLKSMRKLLLLTGALLVSAGCATFKTKQTDETTINPDGTEVRKITTEAEAGTFAAGKSNLASWKANQTDKSQGASVGGLAQESDASNLAKAIAEGATAAAIKSVKPTP